ncbi:hypothetical protein [Flexibacterium corallicola]|uniref:hypothetical protein n=1 Tax=Flexibacterium corallicola TaxID=3037259 RepID=UPI00286F03ED|nr:hypothetical protein [Pseudovibrio sp. M1P-2-3]
MIGKIFTTIALSSALIVPSGLVAFADTATDAASKERTFSFSDLTTVKPGGDASICQKRYGGGYTTTPHPNNKPNHRTTDKGHNFVIAESETEEDGGVFAVHNTYEIVFANEGEAQVVAQMWAIGLTGMDDSVGVFSDGTCRGKVNFKN